MKKHQSNHIPKSERIFNLLWGLGLLVIAYVGITEQEFHLPGRGASNGITFVGLALWVFTAAAIAGAVNLFITIADHYDVNASLVCPHFTSLDCPVFISY